MKLKKRLKLSAMTVFLAMLLGVAAMFFGTEQAFAMEGNGMAGLNQGSGTITNCYYGNDRNWEKLTEKSFGKTGDSMYLCIYSGLIDRDY